MKQLRNSASPSRALLGRELRLFLKEVPAALLIAVLLGLFCALAASALSRGAESGYTLAPVAVVDEDGSFASSLGISIIAKQDFATPLEIVKTDPKEAQAGLESGRFSAALFLPSGFADDILGGVESHAKLVLSDSVPVHGDVVRLLCDFGQELLRTGQYGVFAGERLVLDAAPELHGAYLKKSNALFLGKALSDPGIHRVEVSFAGTGLGTLDWYLALYAAAFFLLLGLGCGFPAKDLETPLLRRLAAMGIGPSRLLLTRLAALLGFYLILAAAGLVLTGLKCALLGYVTLFTALLTLAAVGMALTVCLPRDKAVTAMTALAGVNLFLSGGILPRMELPRLLTTIGDLLPLGTAALTIAPALGGRVSPPHLLLCLFWCALSWAAMELRLYRNRKGAWL